jgi:hypothetical protein
MADAIDIAPLLADGSRSAVRAEHEPYLEQVLPPTP